MSGAPNSNKHGGCFVLVLKPEVLDPDIWYTRVQHVQEWGAIAGVGVEANDVLLYQGIEFRRPCVGCF